MELALLPKNIATPRKYKFYKIESTPLKQVEEVVAYEFFFLGKSHNKIDKLVEFFEGGYIAETVENAKNILKRILDKNAAIPSVIILEPSVEIEDLKKFYAFICQHNKLRGIPVVLDADDLTAEKSLIFKKSKFIDEIFPVSGIDNKFLSKIKFIARVKKVDSEKRFEKQIETSVKKLTGKTPYSKRAFDILASGLALLLLSPVFALIALAIKLESKGPIFYISKRAGRGYKIFNFFKFRTMEVDADKKIDQLVHLNQYDANAQNGPVFFKVSNDPRVTKVGAFLRNTSLDELPQLVNVFLGDMSLVGNRPLPLYEAATLTTDECVDRFMAPAGITGLWQIKKRGQSDMSVEERINLDIMYANKHSFMYDLWIMANTPTALFQKSNV
jgi:lipopolysaccharide/colanic/teichoic acid biosynthesis glycosyltransferase